MPTIRAMPVELMYSTPAKLRRIVVAPSTAACSYTAVRSSFAPPSISPRRSITDRPASCRTSESKRVVGICPLSQVQPKLHRVVSLVAANGHLVDHVPDQEQAPAARGLLARKLRVEVGNLR